MHPHLKQYANRELLGDVTGAQSGRLSSKLPAEHDVRSLEALLKGDCQQGWREGSAVKSTGHSCRELGFNSQHQYGSSQPSSSRGPNTWPPRAPQAARGAQIHTRGKHPYTEKYQKENGSDRQPRTEGIHVRITDTMPVMLKATVSHLNIDRSTQTGRTGLQRSAWNLWQPRSAHVAKYKYSIIAATSQPSLSSLPAPAWNYKDRQAFWSKCHFHRSKC